MGEELFLEANDFASKFKSSFSCLLENKNFVDVTLVCHDGQISAHKVILSASSSLFLQILKANPHPHPLLYLKGVSIRELSSLLSFLYAGEVKVAKDELDKFLETAKELLIEGLLSNEPEKKEGERKENDLERETTQHTEAFTSTLPVSGEPSKSSIPKAQVHHEKDIKCEPEIIEEYQYNYSNYVEQGDYFGQMEAATSSSSELEVFETDWEKTRKPQKKEGRLLRNPVWDYFLKLENRSDCMTCGFSSGGYNTSTLIKHLETRHPGIYAEYRQKYHIAWRQKMNTQKISLIGSEPERPHNTGRVKGKLNKSPVHYFFTRVEHYSNCNYCPAKMLGHNPSTLTKHLEAHHLEQFRQFKEMYKQAWENKRKTMELKMDQHEENYDQWNDTFEISYNENSIGDNDEVQNNYIGWNSTVEGQDQKPE